ncbi:PEP-CTERM sorting domain-containing protein [Pirellulimonas nuda]|nr:PEP-CTERM sorting domain-containing protein [Pirellulimonas nuda]
MTQSVPEPRSFALVALAGLACAAGLLRRTRVAPAPCVALLLAATAAMLLPAQHAAAAVVTWGPATAISTGPGNSSDVVFGDVVEAFTATTPNSPQAGMNVTVNGVTFVATSSLLPTSLLATNDFSTTTNGGDPEYDQLVSTLSYGGGGDPFTITLGDGDGDTSVLGSGLLTVGKQYQIQLWFVDSRNTRVMQFGDGNGNTVDLDDQFAIGAFIADATTQDITLDAVGFGNAHFTAYVTTGELELPTVTVNTLTGAVVLSNPTSKTFDMDLYRLSGPAGSLNPAGWNSLEDATPNQGQDLAEFPRGDGQGNGWEVLGTPGSTSLAEAFLGGSSELGIGDSISLGNAFDTQGPGANALSFEFRSPTGLVLNANIEYVSTQVAGDYNGNGLVDAADYTVWRDSLGATGAGLAADGDGNNVVNQLDYTYWKSRFSNTAALGGVDAAPVPEPAAATLALIGLAGAMGLTRRRRKGPRTRTPGLDATTFVAANVTSKVPTWVLWPGNVNKDGAVNSGDVALFVAG